ncbi:MAG TPA: hypothetical protein VHM90_21275 [Phycisphaerae bacterium]|nr:hypothetical protein [Phycisphaerae bacterium]
MIQAGFGVLGRRAAKADDSQSGQKEAGTRTDREVPVPLRHRGFLRHRGRFHSRLNSRVIGETNGFLNLQLSLHLAQKGPLFLQVVDFLLIGHQILAQAADHQFLLRAFVGNAMREIDALLGSVLGGIDRAFRCGPSKLGARAGELAVDFLLAGRYQGIDGASGLSER